MCILFYIREIFYKSLFIRLLPVISNTRQPSLEQLQSNFPANIYEMIMRGKNCPELPGLPLLNVLNSQWQVLGTSPYERRFSSWTKNPKQINVHIKLTKAVLCLLKFIMRIKLTLCEPWIRIMKLFVLLHCGFNNALLENFTLIWRRHNYRWRAAKSDLY